MEKEPVRLECRSCGFELQPRFKSCPRCASRVDKANPPVISRTLGVEDELALLTAVIHQHEATIRELQSEVAAHQLELRLQQECWEVDRRKYIATIEKLKSYQEGDTEKMKHLQKMANHLRTTLTSPTFEAVCSGVKLSETAARLLKDPTLFNPINMSIEPHKTDTHVTPSVVVKIPPEFDSEVCRSFVSALFPAHLRPCFSKYKTDDPESFRSTASSITFVLWPCQFNYEEAVSLSAEFMPETGGNCIFIFCIPCEIVNQVMAGVAKLEKEMSSGLHWCGDERKRHRIVLFLQTQESRQGPNKEITFLADVALAAQVADALGKKM